MASTARDRLAKTLLGDAKSAFSTEITAGLDALTLDVEGFGSAKLPMTPARIRKLIELGAPARFGRGEETLTDPDVRDTWEIPANLVRAAWDPATLREVSTTIKEDLGMPNGSSLTLDLHSLLVYERGQFFLKHQDTEKSDDMVGTLVVTLPSAYTGGELLVGQGEEWKSYPRPYRALSLVAFYADCQHEVLKVKSGYRVTLTFNLLLHGDTTPRRDGDEGTADELADLLREHFSVPATSSWGRQSDSPPSRLVYLLDHEYTPRALKWTRLKGADAQRVPPLRTAAEAAGYEAVLGLADVKTTHDAWPADEDYEYRRYHDDDPDDDDYVINDEIQTEVELTHWTGPDGDLEETSLDVDGSEACASTPHGDLEPYQSDYEGYMGNWGNTLDRWYHRGAVIVWPEDQAFANRAETSPRWALDELITMASAGDISGAREAAATLEPVWNGSGYSRSLPESSGEGGLFGKALRAADALDDPGLAAMLLTPFRISQLTGHYAGPFGNVAARYGQKWTDELLRGWFGGNLQAWDPRRSGQTAWIADSLPGLCTELHGAGRTGAARTLLELSWDRIREDTRAGLASSSPRARDESSRELGKPLTSLLTAAAAIKATDTVAAISGYVLNLEGDPVTALQVATLRTAAALPEQDRGDFAALAADCASRLRDRLARPVRAEHDWSITLPPGGCTCDLCQTLTGFLSAPDRRVFDWPLAKQRRQHIHTRIDAAELPVTHTTRRTGSPYTLVLRKTDALFTSEQQSRTQDKSDLHWLSGIFSDHGDCSGLPNSARLAT